MSDDLKSFPASEQKLSRLRSEGIFPFSKMVFACSVLLALSLSLLVIPSIFSKDLINFAKMAFSADVNFTKILSEGFSVFSSTFFFISVFFIGSLALFGLLQSRFYFNLSLIKFDLGRFFSQIFSLRISISSIFSFIILVVATISVVVFSYSLLVGGHDELIVQVSKKVKTSNSYLSFLTNKKELALSHLSSLFSSFNPLLLICVFFSLVLGLSCYFFRYITFKRDHMMTRSELESEFKEQELSYELKEQMSERNNSFE